MEEEYVPGSSVWTQRRSKINYFLRLLKGFWLDESYQAFSRIEMLLQLTYSRTITLRASF